MKKRIWISTTCLLALCLLLAGCSKAPAQPDTAEAFLRECFTLNKDGRFDTMDQSVQAAAAQLAASDTGSIQSLPPEINQRYYRGMSTLATTACLDAMAANRLPSQFDRMVSEADLTARIDTLRLTPSGDNAYTFEITYDSDAVNTLLNVPITGQVTVQEENGSVLVNSLTINAK